MSETMRVLVAKIRTDGGTQSREKLDDGAIQAYAEALAARNNTMPPVVVFYDSTDYWLADGFHRVRAATLASKSSIMAEVRQGTRRDAILFSVGANDTHGVRRTNNDKRRAVMMLLHDEEWCKRSDRWIADKCGTGHPFVATVRSQLVSDSSSESTRLGQDGKVRKLSTKSAVKLASSKTAAPSDLPTVPVLKQAERAGAQQALADVISLHGDEKDAELASESALQSASEEAPREPSMVLIDLDYEIQRCAMDWVGPAERFIEKVERWIPRLRIIFDQRDKRERRDHG